MRYTTNTARAATRIYIPTYIPILPKQSVLGHLSLLDQKLKNEESCDQKQLSLSARFLLQIERKVLKFTSYTRLCRNLKLFLRSLWICPRLRSTAGTLHSVTTVLRQRTYV